jgi:hypothetical protein
MSSLDPPVKTLLSGLDLAVAHGCAHSFFDFGDHFGITEVDVETDRELGFTFQGKSSCMTRSEVASGKCFSAELRE